jgi:hypothetical protein
MLPKLGRKSLRIDLEDLALMEARLPRQTHSKIIGFSCPITESGMTSAFGVALQKSCIVRVGARLVLALPHCGLLPWTQMSTAPAAQRQTIDLAGSIPASLCALIASGG